MLPTFPHSPDAFWLACPASEAAITVQPYLSPFGETGELLCHAGGVLIGRLSKHHHAASGSLSITLLPRLDRMRPYDWPAAGDFLHALLGILRDVPTAVLCCERDTDQADVDQLGSYADVEQALQLVMRYCQDGNSACPNFIYSQPALP
ncbi:hypothetical protein F2P45_24925 [Massilia sp. CCM 8733]|uniref:Uncharacterized protein n=1 Tax=Massilia mucilaginosa TaxID=2609282 RepID=A0ABX0NYZ1_9BURK|nr:hypothetical protein [Massilia mucilaginosa]NHZ92223.1 hypothetical protein [Massilia mucilaginosa]